ncbi:DNA sulfur modification protein DndB [Alkalihalophilus pseudofirmus]|uniref:DNA sulfur modification protein DndB n=1 Tax=Alkalihalophilus pseudofirmus TaxID=79885 RepID=UPI00259BEE9A|nr:DNA sulfur modification protein DndB [Alkalihalophilus pseudofirmus]WEG18573.1 DNA sulfur modification protein DndB [Alkalihalophilus pseudofirmus]
MKVDRKELEEVLIPVLMNIKTNRDKNRQFKDMMWQYDVAASRVTEILAKADEVVPNMDLKELIIVNFEAYNLLKIRKIDPKLFFNDREIKEAKSTFVGEHSGDDIAKFPYTFKNVLKTSDGYFALVSVSAFRKLENGKQIQYNPNTQRNTKKTKTTDGDMIETPRVNQKSIKEIKELFFKGKLISSTLAFNARLGTSDVDEELIYDDEEKTLTITEGTLFDCIDGYHRYSATIEAQAENPDIDMEFMVKIVNLTESQAKEHFTQTNTINPIPKSHKRKMDENNYVNFLVNYIEGNSELKGKIVSDPVVSPKSDSLTSYGTLGEAIEKHFNVDNKGAAIKLGRYLTEFFNEICYSYPDEFLGDVAEYKKKTYINSQSMFAGFIALAKRMHDENIEIKKINDILNNIDFSKDNNKWDNILSGNRTVAITQYFNELNIDQYK